MRTQISKYSIKIPYGITIIYNKKIQILIVIGPFKKKSLKLKLKVFIDQSKKILSVSPVSLDQISNTERKKINILRNTTLINIKQMLIESRVLVHKKLKINGIGYRAIIAEKFNNRLLTLNLGFSHSLYVKIPKNLKIKCCSKTTIYVFGHSYETVASFSALIRIKKLPEPYKGKGILYDNETITLKLGKKI